MDNTDIPKLAQCSKISLLHKKGSKDDIEMLARIARPCPPKIRRVHTQRCY